MAKHVYGQNKLTKVMWMLVFGQELPHSLNGKYIYLSIIYGPFIAEFFL